MARDRDILPTTRIATAAWLLFQSDDGFTVHDLAARLNVTPRGARAMLQKMALAIPLIEEENPNHSGAIWRICSERENPHE